MGSRCIQFGWAQKTQFPDSGYLRSFPQRPRLLPLMAHLKRRTLAIVATAAINSLGLLEATTAQSHAAKEDLTARECLALARQERQNKNWSAAIAYYKQFEAEYNSNISQARETITYRLEYLDCLLVSKQHSESITLIDSIRTVRGLPRELLCELLFEKGKSEYELKRFTAARTSLQESIKTAQGTIRTATWRIKANEAHLLVAQCLTAENRLTEAIAHLSTELALDSQTHAIAAALKTRLYLELKLPEQAWSVLKTSLTVMRSWNLPASCDALLLETANQFCAAAAPEKGIQCLLLTIDPTISSEAIIRHVKEIELQLRRQDKAPGNVQRSAECWRVLSMLSNELTVLKSVQEQKQRAIKNASETLISMGRFRDAAVLLRTFTSILALPDQKILDQMRCMLLGCLLQMERWDDAIQTADSLQRAQTEPRLRLESTLLKAIAHSKSNSPALAIQIFETICRESTGSPCAIRAAILCASTQLQTGDYFGAIHTASNFISSNPKHPLLEIAEYLLTAAQLAAKQHKDALDSAKSYLKDRSKTENREAMYIYKAKAQLGLCEPKAAAETLKLYLSECQAGEMNNQARLLLGDTLLSLGDAGEGVAALQAVTPEDTVLFDEAKLRLAKALSLHSKTKDSAAILTEFVKVRLASDRIAEGCRALLQTSNANHTRAEALETLWSLLGHPDAVCRNRFANEIITVLEKAYTADACGEEFVRQLSSKAATLLSRHSKTTVHCYCSVAVLWGVWKTSRRDHPAEAATNLTALEIATQQVPSMVAPQILSDLAKHHYNEGKAQSALAAWHELIKWNPHTPLKDIALLRLGAAAATNGETHKAISLFQRFEGECRRSALMPEMLLNRATVYLKNNEPQKQFDDLTRIAAARSVPVKVRAQALVELGEMKINKQEYANAIVYFQRAYVTCIASREHAARAYERCAFAFETLNQWDAAAQVYAELLKHPDLADTAAANECRSRIKSSTGL